MNITLEACKPDTYVGCPAPAVTPPTDCEAGYEIGNGTITCATEVPVPLAATGGDAGMVWALVSVALALIAVGTSTLALAASIKSTRIRRGRDRLARIEPTLDDRGSLER